MKPTQIDNVAYVIKLIFCALFIFSMLIMSFVFFCGMLVSFSWLFVLAILLFLAIGACTGVKMYDLTQSHLSAKRSMEIDKRFKDLTTQWS